MHPQHWKFKGKAKATSSGRTPSSNRPALAAGQADSAGIEAATSPEVEMTEALSSQL
jgi:hypothetical protein